MAERIRDGALLRDADFLKLWGALSVSLFGSQLTALALPLIAVLALNATPLQMGLLAAVGQAPFLLISLPAGLLADRVRRRPILIATDLGSALLLLSVPALAWSGQLSFAQLCLVAFGVGACEVLGEVAHYAYAPGVIGRARLVKGNSRFQVSHSAAAAAGPGLGGLLIQLLSAPLAVLLDALSFLVSAALVSSIKRPEPRPANAARGESPLQAIAAGLRMVIGHRLLRPLILTQAVMNIFVNTSVALYVLYLAREFQLSPATIGLIFAVGGACTIPGALLAPWAGRTFGVGRVLIGGWMLTALAGLLVPLAAGPAAAVIATLAVARALSGLVGTVVNIQQWSLRQAITPDRLHGRVTATHRFIVYGAGALGALAGGALAGAIGLRRLLFLCAVGALLAPAIAAASPLRRLRDQPAAPEP